MVAPVSVVSAAKETTTEESGAGGGEGEGAKEKRGGEAWEEKGRDMCKVDILEGLFVFTTT